MRTVLVLETGAWLQKEVGMSRLNSRVGIDIGKSPSEKSFRVLLNAGEIPPDSNAYYKIIASFLCQLQLISLPRQHAADTVVNAVVTDSLTAADTFTFDELAVIQDWLSDRRFMILITHMMSSNASEIKPLCRMIATEFCTIGHAAFDVLGVLSARLSDADRRKLYADIQALIQTQPKASSTDLFNSTEQVQIIGSGVNEDIQRSKETLASLIQDVKKVSSTEDATQKIQEQAALAISHILNTQGNASAHGTSFLHAIYDYFIHENNAAHKGSFLKGYSEDKLAEYFKVLLQTLALLVEKNISMNTFEQLDKIFFPAADRREFSNFLNDSLSLKIEILYFDLISLVKECSTIPECAKKLASKFHSHKIKYKQLHVNYLNDDSTDIDELSKQELKLRSEFLDSSMGQTQLNKKVQQDLSDCSQRILMMQQSHKMALGEYASEHDNAQSEEFKKIKWAEYLTNEKELIQSYSNADYLFKYFYERELGLIEDAYDKNKGVIGEVTAEQLNRQKIEEAKQRFNVDLFTQEYMSKSSLVRAFPCTKFAIETDTAVALVITNQYEARAYHKTIIETQKKAAKINQKPYREIQAQYNPVVRCKLNAEHRTRLERRWRVARYIGLGTLGLVGLGLLGFASAATFGLIHLAWVIPVVSFSVGGTAVAGTTIGVVANTPSYRDVIVGTCKKMAKRIGLLQHPYSPLVNELDEEAIDYASGSEAEDDGNDSPLMHREEPDFTKDPPKIITLEGDTSSSEDEDEDEELASIGSSAAGSPHYSILPPHSVTPYDNKRLLLPPPHQCLFQPVGGVDSDGDTFSQDRRPTIVV